VADGGETIVSRGELIEIGGAFRIPSILEKSGTVLVEVGTTNRTRLADYTAALSARTQCCLKVHRSNFRLAGFVTDVEIAELVEAMSPRGVPTLHDIGSGLMIDLGDYGLGGEPLVRDSVDAGSTVVFSGDKLLGGPQAGIIVGPADILQRAAVNPLARALRPGKTVLAALEATLALYRDPESALTEVGRRFLELVLLEENMAHFRAVIAECGRFPELAEAFYCSGPQLAVENLTDYLKETSDKGLLAVSEPKRAAQLFFGMLRGDLYLRRLLALDSAPEPEEVDRAVGEAVTIFIAAHAPRT